MVQKANVSLGNRIEEQDTEKGKKATKYSSLEVVLQRSCRRWCHADRNVKSVEERKEDLEKRRITKMYIFSFRSVIVGDSTVLILSNFSVSNFNFLQGQDSAHK